LRPFVISPRLARVTIEVPYQPLPIHQSDVRYAHGPDSAVQPGVPVGMTIEFDWSDSAIYPGTSRKFWEHVPARYDPSEPASLMVFQDGWWYLDPEGEVRGAIVLDNLVHRGDIPAIIGVFVDPGVVPDAEDPKNRNIEYDASDDRYVSFLLTEIIPEVTKHYSIAEDPEPGSTGLIPE
jgi:enterochelin esterase family protein